MARPRKDSARDTRSEILEAALDLFSQKGYFGTSVRDLARSVGVRESALYHHFASKAAVLEALVRELGLNRAGQLNELDLPGLLETMTPRELIRQLLTMLVAEWSTDRQRRMARLMLSEGPLLAEQGLMNPGIVFQLARKTVSTFFAELMRRKVIRKVDPEAAALALMGPLVVLRMTYLVMPSGPPDMKGLMADLDRHLDFFWAAVQAP